MSAPDDARANAASQRPSSQRAAMAPLSLRRAQAMRVRDSLLGWAPWVLATLIIAGIVHIVSVLAMPRLATEDAFARLARVAPTHRMTIIDNGAPDRPLLPYEDPATVIAVCRFDLQAGPLRLKASLTGDGVVLMSFRTRFGAPFYAMNDRGATRGQIDVLVVTPAQREAIEANDPEDELPSELRITAPMREGFVLLRALAAEPGQAAQARALLAGATCATGDMPK